MGRKKADEELEIEKKIESKNEKKEKIETEQTDKVMTEDEKRKIKVEKIIKKAKEKGQITYGELATELDDINPEQIDKVFDEFEKLGVDLLKEEFEEEPNEEDLKEVEELKLATAIKLAKDSVSEIEKAGYAVTVEEIDGQNDYQIIIKVQK